MDSNKKITWKSQEALGIIAVLLSFVLSITFIQTYKLERETIKPYHISKDVIIVNADDTVYKTYLDSFDNTSELGYISAKGWAVKIGQPLTGYTNLSFLLRDVDGNFYKMKTVSENRQSVTDYFNDGVDYGNSGFWAWGKDTLPSGNYQACLLFTEQDGTSHLFVYDNFIGVL